MSLTSEQVKREMGYDTKNDRAMIDEPRNMNIAGATVIKGGILERPGDQPSPNVERQKNAGEIADAKRFGGYQLLRPSFELAATFDQLIEPHG